MIDHHSYNQCLDLSSGLTLHYCLLNYLLLGKELERESFQNSIQTTSSRFSHSYFVPNVGLCALLLEAAPGEWLS
jgi:hypothetical protein